MYIMESKSSGCDARSSNVVFACSGAADVGELTDLVARKMNKDKVAQMKCLAFVGAGIPKMIESVKGAKILVIDGCDLDCGKIVMQKNGLSDFTHLRLSDIGYKKGSSAPEKQRTDAIYKVACSLL